MAGHRGMRSGIGIGIGIEGIGLVLAASCGAVWTADFEHRGDRRNPGPLNGPHSCPNHTDSAKLILPEEVRRQVRSRLASGGAVAERAGSPQRVASCKWTRDPLDLFCIRSFSSVEASRVNLHRLICRYVSSDQAQFLARIKADVPVGDDAAMGEDNPPSAALGLQSHMYLAAATREMFPGVVAISQGRTH